MIILLSVFVLCCYLISVSAPVYSTHNLPSFRASSQILASLSSYQYTRKAWRREALEMLLDAMFFQMDEACIGYWKAVIDNLMTHDKTTFKDLLGKTGCFAERYPYNMVDFVWNFYNRCPMAHLWGWAMGCLLWLQSLINILPHSLLDAISCYIALCHYSTQL